MLPPFDLTDTDCPFAAALAPDAPRFSSEDPEDDLSAVSMDLNRTVLSQARLCLCEYSDDVIDKAEVFGMRIGCTRSKAGQLMDIALMQEALPRLAYVLRVRGFMPRELLLVLANAILPFLAADADDPELDVTSTLSEMEPQLLAALLPSVDGAKIYGPYALLALLREVIEQFEEMLRPPDENDEKEFTESLVISDDGSSRGYVMGVMDRDKAWEIKSAVRSVQDQQNCTEVDALLMLVRGQTTADVSLNLYCHLNGGRLWSVQTGWLSGTASQHWLGRVSNIRIISDSTSDGYRPTEAQVAFVRGRDGTCMFPGCSIDAERCQIDHIEPYNFENPSAGGLTDTENLQALCQRHHNLKTDKLFDVIRYSDGRTVWSSRTSGTQATSTPSGPAHGPGRVSVSARLRRRSKVVRDYNDERVSARDAAEAARHAMNDPPPWENWPRNEPEYWKPDPPQLAIGYTPRKALPPGKGAG